MKKGLTEIVFILDRSGSMSGLEADTIGGFNAMLAQQKQQEGEAYLSTVLFNHESRVLYDRVPLEKVEPMTGRDYKVGGNTALLDAVGDAIRHIANVHKYAREEDVPEKTLFIITTDGMENASRQYSYQDVKRLVEKQKERFGWEFIFLGANIDAIDVAQRFGVDSRRAVRYENDSAGTRLNFETMARMVGCARMAESAEEFSALVDSDDMLSAIRVDYENRHRGNSAD